jgi:hypothetical protein
MEPIILFVAYLTTLSESGSMLGREFFKTEILLPRQRKYSGNWVCTVCKTTMQILDIWYVKDKPVRKYEIMVSVYWASMFVYIAPWLCFPYDDLIFFQWKYLLRTLFWTEALIAEIIMKTHNLMTYANNVLRFEAIKYVRSAILLCKKSSGEW